MDDWFLKIIRAQNGYLLEYEYESEDGLKKVINVIQEDPKDELKEHEELLQYITEYFAFLGSKHDAERLRVVREKKKGNRSNKHS